MPPKVIRNELVWCPRPNKPGGPSTLGGILEASDVVDPRLLTPSVDVLKPPEHQSFWLWVMCLTGVDYFSTLGYQPSIAFEAVGLLAPLATIVLIAVTLGCALPVYSRVAEESPLGHGSISMLERLLHGWTAKFLVLILLGFAATDFVITQTLSAADAAEHLIHNPFWADAPAIHAEPDGADDVSAGAAGRRCFCAASTKSSRSPS